MLYVPINTGQKIHRTKVLSARPDGEIDKNFLLAKISGSTLFMHGHTQVMQEGKTLFKFRDIGMSLKQE